MTEHEIQTAAKAARNAYREAIGKPFAQECNDDEMMIWRSVVTAVSTSLSTDWPLRARVWTRTSVEPHEKVLEIEGAIDDTHMTVRHTQSLDVADVDVPGLPELYPSEEVHESASTYARGVFQRHGIEGLVQEAERIMHSMDAARAHYHEGSTKQKLETSAVRKRIDIQFKRRDVTSLALELDGLQSRIVDAQQSVDRHSKASIMLFTDQDKWDRYPSYQAYLDALSPDRSY